MKDIVQALRYIADELERRSADTPPPANEGYLLTPKDGRQQTVDFVVQMLGGTPKPTPERDAALARYEAELNEQWYAGTFRYAGTFPVSELAPADKAYLARAQDRFKGDIMRAGIVGGTHHELNAARRDGEAWRNNYTDEQASVSLRAAVAARL